jgi:class 3 adenylate cyclase
VNLNERLDYFGTTVNVAARTEHEARGGQVMVTEMVANEIEVSELLREQGCPIENCEVVLRGISRPVSLTRVIVAPSAPELSPERDQAPVVDISAASTA